MPFGARRWPAGTVVLAGCYKRDGLVELEDSAGDRGRVHDHLEMRAVDPFDRPASGLGGGCLFGEDRAELKVSTPR
jgi:hypothetical protein